MSIASRERREIPAAPTDTGAARATNTISEMNPEPQRSVGERGNRDGLAAVAITLLTVSLIILLVSKII